ncbi:hypothetical protein SLA2020_467970 [Shorea laevis]
MLWNKSVPLKVVAFAWKALQDRIPIVDNLAKKGLRKKGEDDLCALCGIMLETSEHLLFSCKKAWEIWTACFAWWGFNVVSQEKGWLHLEEHVGLFQRKNTSKVRLVIWFTMLWSFWLWRNQIIFQQEVEPQIKVMELIKFRSFSWAKAKLVPDLSKECWYNFPSKSYAFNWDFSRSDRNIN